MVHSFSYPARTEDGEQQNISYSTLASSSLVFWFLGLPQLVLESPSYQCIQKRRRCLEEVSRLSSIVMATYSWPWLTLINPFPAYVIGSLELEVANAV